MFNVLPSPLSKLALGGLAAIGFVGAVWFYGNSRESLGASNERNRALSEAAAALVVETKRVSAVGSQLADAVAAANALEPKVIEKYRYVKAKAPPLPAGCVVDPERLRSITSAIDAANAASRIGPAVRTSPGPGQQ